MHHTGLHLYQAPISSVPGSLDLLLRSGMPVITALSTQINSIPILISPRTPAGLLADSYLPGRCSACFCFFILLFFYQVSTQAFPAGGQRRSSCDSSFKDSERFQSVNTDRSLIQTMPGAGYRPGNGDFIIIIYFIAVPRHRVLHMDSGLSTGAIS